ncbi:AI-2E family transporter [Pediococcus stilesii]|uniref:AI-2E family transporter n=1 Tax=Pediococcus stilesii TaxID=331679 RepID=A0A5R9BWB8_9LACO|nr:AI-2E family transporter [Pediococcus stilesii]TLQ04984.1 AI-2E family transporter [Pediococcus stilesii]
MNVAIELLKKKSVQLWLTLFGIIGVIFLLRDFMSQILLIVIFSFVSYVGIQKIRKFTKVSQPVGTLIFYIVLLAFMGFVFSMTASMIYDQLKGIPALIRHAINSDSFSNQYVQMIVDEVRKNSQAVKGSQYLAMSGLNQLGRIGVAMEHIIVALLLSLVFNLTFNHLKSFGHSILNSRHSVMFGNIYLLLKKYVMILGTVIETQLIICSINTTLMTIGLWALGIPKLLLLAIIVFILGLVPVAGVLISLIPLSIVAFSANGIVSIIEVMCLVILIHFFESYFLHPRLMAGATDLPIFVTFITLIIAAKMIGTWGLIVGIPTVAFFIDFLGIKLKRHHPKSAKDVIEDQIE